MSLGAIDFGIIVDGAVIIVENCLRHLAHEQARLGRMLTLRERLRVVHGAACEVRQATQFGEAIIIMVYLPILALGGVEGKMFHPMALTVIFALAASFVLSLTFIPAGIALFVTGRVTERENPLVRGAKRLYAPVLAWALSWRIPVVAGAVAAFAGSLALFRTLGQEFIPTLDEGNLAYQSLRIPSTSLRQSLAMQFEVEKAIAALPEVDVVFSKTGTTEVAFDPMPPSISDGFIILKPRTQWPDPDLPREKLVAKVGEATSHLPGQLYEASQPIQLRFNELLAGVRGDLAIKVYGDDFDRMRETADAIAQVVREVRGAADVKVEQTEGLPVLSVDVDREASARYGLSAADVQEVLSIAVGGRQAGLVFEGDRRFPLVVRLAGGVRDDLEALGELPVPTPHEERAPPPARLDPLRPSLTRPQFVPLGSIARIEVGEGPNQISRENGKRRVTVTANVRGRDLGGFVGEVRRRVESGVRLPAGSWIDYGGAFQNLLAARSRLAVLVPVCFLVIFLLLHSTFDSTRHAALVFSGVPLGLTGGVLALWARGMPFSISAAVGFIALSGVAVLNGLVMVSRINQLRRDGHALEDAIREGALTRLRPVLMTALVASLGFLPMALSTGSGAEVQRPLATVVIGGIVSSTMLTLVVLPALYRTFHRDGRTG